MRWWTGTLSLALASTAGWFVHDFDHEVSLIRRCEPWVWAAKRQTIERERSRCDQEVYEAYRRGWTNAAMDTCAPPAR
jgi:hypothetical protein